VAALSKLDDPEPPRHRVVNLGTGRGHSVLEVVKSFEAASGRPIAYDIVARRPGDVAECFADVARARDCLGWKAQRGLDAMCAERMALAGGESAWIRTAERRVISGGAFRSCRLAPPVAPGATTAGRSHDGLKRGT
jgi:hypothetical protein